MIGILPRPLAASPYRSLITSRVWAKARERMGYRPQRDRIDAPDLRAPLHRRAGASPLPKDLDAVTWRGPCRGLARAPESNPQLHDKIEFEIAQTVLDFSFEQNLETRHPGVFGARTATVLQGCPARPHLSACLDPRNPRQALTR